MVKIMDTDIRTVKDMNGLITYLAEKLEWKIDLDDFEDVEDISYDFEAEDIGLKEEAFAKIVSLRQLPPLVDGQKWGIFCVEFDSKRFEVTALRKILSGLIPKRRNSAEHAVWKQKDLLFICFWGNDNERTIGLAHFEDSDQGLPQIKMISCCPAVEDFTQIAVFENRLKNLKWPSNYLDHEKWQTDWSSAFVTGYKQTIRDASTLTIQLAAEAQEIKKRILAILEVETSNGYVHLLYDKFKDTLIHDMTESQFADMYAQTVVYGLFSARCMDKTQDDFSASEAIELIPNTNPFLKSLMKECLGSQNNTKLSFDELEIGNVVDLLLHTKTESIIEDFNRQTGGGREDPVIHFYEEFLTAYDKSQKVQRGVFYTPQPVVKFIVNAVDSIIKNEFGYEDGLASTETKTVKYMRDSKRIVNGVKTKVEDSKVVPAIQILDPATGTGTFLRETILRIYENFKNKNRQLNSEELKKKWNSYIPEHLLPRINGFELMMAPYAVAHMKLAMVLKDTGYDFNYDERLKVFLTNTLEEPGKTDGQMTLWDDPLASESIAANRVKMNNGINVVIGNPPYSSSSLNKNDFINILLKTYKTEPGGSKKLDEQKHSIDSDEIKFIRYGQYNTDRNEIGITAYINPHAFLDKPTFRGVRWQLLNHFDEVYIVNLHGNSNHNETAPNGEKDENVFDIQQGVCINIFVKKSISRQSNLAKVYYTDVFGKRTDKYNWLLSNSINPNNFIILNPTPPYYMMVPFASEYFDMYYSGFCLEKLFTKHLEGIQSGKDKFVIQDTQAKLDAIINDLINLDSDLIREKYDLKKDGRDWSVSRAQNDIKNNYHNGGKYFKILVRPFDEKWSFYTGNSSGFIKCCRNAVSKEMIGKDNIAFTLTRNAMPQKPYSNFHIIRSCAIGRYIGDFATSTQIFPIYSYVSNMMEEIRINNICFEIIDQFNCRLAMSLVDEVNSNKHDSYTLLDLVDYIFGVLNSSYYTQKYKDCLCRDFPYIPYPISVDIFWKIQQIGERLRVIHLDWDSIDIDDDYQFCGDGDCVVSLVNYKDSKIFINKFQYFSNIPLDIWNYWIGGYQIVQKWIKEKKGEELSSDSINCFRRIIKLVHLTIEYSKKLDEILKMWV